jgi:hypothetical protein
LDSDSYPSTHQWQRGESVQQPAFHSANSAAGLSLGFPNLLLVSFRFYVLIETPTMHEAVMRLTLEYEND